MFSGKKGLFIGVLLCLIVLVGSGGISLATFCWMIGLLVLIPLIHFIGKKGYRERKLWKRRFVTVVRAKQSKVIAKKQPDPEKATLVKKLNQLLSDLKKDMDAFSLAWHVQHSNQQQGKLTILLSHQVFVCELQALTKSLAHLGEPGDDVRLLSEDLKFYQQWVENLSERFANFQRYAMQQEKNVIHVLANAKRFHSSIVEEISNITETPEFWKAHGCLTTLESLLNAGTIPADLLLPQMQIIQKELESLMANQEQDFVYHMLLY